MLIKGILNPKCSVRGMFLTTYICFILTISLNCSHRLYDHSLFNFPFIYLGRGTF